MLAAPPAIVEPAHKAGLDIEDGLVEVLLADMRPYGAAGLGVLESSRAPSGARMFDSDGACRTSRCPVTTGCSRWRPRTGRCGCGTWPGQGARR